MKNHKYKIVLIATLTGMLSSCSDWLLAPQPNSTDLDDFYTGGEACIQNVNACYVPLMWEFNNTYFPEWFIGDVVSDDALKGGQTINDMADVYDMENWKTASNNSLLLEFYRAQYQGISRCNLALQYIPGVALDSVMSQGVKNRLIGEASFLRALYYFRLVRVFGGVPLVDFVVSGSSAWKQPRATAEQVYEHIFSDLQRANANLWPKSRYAKTQLGRATKGAAQAMLLKTHLYRHNYVQAKAWGDSIMASGEYELLSNYEANFTLEGENGMESVFEIQFMEEPNSDYGEGNGFSRGTFTVVLTRSRSSLLGGGWGFNKPTHNLYQAFDANDPRRDVTILNPTASQMENPTQETYLGSKYVSRKYALYNSDNSSWFPLTHAARGPINYKTIRYADVLLMYAEAAAESGDLAAAKNALEKVRERARNGNAILPAFPNYNGYADTQADLIKAIRSERRVELAMEGHRWFDLCRWGIAKETMDAYKATETEAAQAEMAIFIAGKHELFPIPSEEIDLNPMEQNPGYH